MTTYLHQPRQIRILSETDPTFPATVTIRFRLAPAQLFGAGEGPIRAIRLGSDYEMRWDTNTDRSSSRPTPGFSSIHLKTKAIEGEFEVDGDEVSFTFSATSEVHFIGTLQFLYFALPAALTVVLPDPVYVISTEGAIGTTPFRVEHTRSATPVRVLDDRRLTELIESGLSSLQLLAKELTARLLAATRYVHTAARLLACGYSPWEFMAEALLNYSKALEVLFGDSRDDQRSGMRALGISEPEIEGRFIPVTLLRDFLDVAHPKLAQLDSQRLNLLYLFLLGLESDFQNLLGKARDAASAGAWTPLPPPSTGIDPADLKMLDRILAADQELRRKRSEDVESNKRPDG